MNRTNEPFSIEKLKKEYCITDEQISNCGLTRTALESIFIHYNSLLPTLEQYKNKFISDVLANADAYCGFHSYGGRVKEPYHLLEKIVRKKTNNDQKYHSMTANDYYMYITDLIGCRVLLVYKEDWIKAHEYIVTIIENNPEKYIDDTNYPQSYQRMNDGLFIAEQPKIYLREGDDEAVYKDYALRNEIVIDRKGYYRSAHYIIRFKEYYLELQIRSLFEEAWGEVDHNVLYPLYKDNNEFVDYSRILNRTAGLGDEIAGYFKRYLAKKNLPGNNTLKDTPMIAYESLISPDAGNGYLRKSEDEITTDAVSADSVLEDIIFND